MPKDQDTKSDDTVKGLSSMFYLLRTMVDFYNADGGQIRRKPNSNSASL